MFYDVRISLCGKEEETLINGECIEGEQRAWNIRAKQLANKHKCPVLIEFKPKTAMFRIEPDPDTEENL